MNCRELTERVMALRAGELNLRARLALQLHAAFCDCCRNLLSTYDTTVAVSVELADREIPEAVSLEFEAMMAAAMAAPVDATVADADDSGGA